jgi:beta-glucanase (GH16 family)
MNAAKLKGYSLIWSDEFSGDAVDLSKWGFQEGTGTEYGLTQWGNGEEQYYRSENARVSDGNLVIKARRESFEGMQYTSSRLRTQPSSSFKYGMISARIKLPPVEGLWPAFWLLPNDNEYGAWAASGEIDIMENRGRVMSETSAAAHYGGAYPLNSFSSQSYIFPEGQSAAAYHIYSLEWTPESLKWCVDDNLFFELKDWSTLDSEGKPFDKPAPFDKEFCVLLNLAVGGQFDGFAVPPVDFEEAEMLVDYVRVYQKD